MTDTSILQEVRPPVQSQPLACRLCRKNVIGRRGPVPFMAEIELENLSTSDVDIEYHLAVLQYLNLIVCDARGKVVSEGHFGDRFSPFADRQVLRLGPGEKFHANVHLLATMPRGPIASGNYFVHAVYEYHGFQAESEPMEVMVE